MKKKILLPLSTLAVAGGLGLGLLGTTGSLGAAAADENDTYVKREDNAGVLALADDVDDDREDDLDRDDRTRDQNTADRTGVASQLTKDGTVASRNGTVVSRDASRADDTRDDRTRDSRVTINNDLTGSATRDATR
jgi:hypothetical protein